MVSCCFAPLVQAITGGGCCLKRGQSSPFLTASANTSSKIAKVLPSSQYSSKLHTCYHLGSLQLSLAFPKHPMTTCSHVVASSGLTTLNSKAETAHYPPPTAPDCAFTQGACGKCDGACRLLLLPSIAMVTHLDNY